LELNKLPKSAVVATPVRITRRRNSIAGTFSAPKAVPFTVPSGGAMAGAGGESYFVKSPTKPNKRGKEATHMNTSFSKKAENDKNCEVTLLAIR